VSGSLVRITVDGRVLDVEPGNTVAAALLNHGVSSFRDSVRSEPRGPICGMGICFECRVTVDRRAGVRACFLLCEAGMVIETRSAP